MAVDNTVPPPKPKRAPRRQQKTTKKKALSSTEKQKHDAKKRLAAAKRRETWARKKLANLEKTEEAIKGESTTLIDSATIDDTTPTAQEYIEQSDVIFRPNPGPQEDFLAATEQEVLYGGAAGGGKSFAMLADPLRYCGNKNFRALLLRRTNDDLRELIQNSKLLYPRAFPGAKWSQQASTWTFPSGATIWLTYLDRDDDVLRYQGQAFCWIGFDELTQWPTPYPWDYLRSRLRTTDPELKPYLCMRATTNPGGPGTNWVKRMFIDPAEWGVPFPAQDLETGGLLTYPPDDPRHGEPLFMRRFIPAKLQDNPYLADDGMYQSNLLAMPESQRRQLLYGDWDVVDDAAFPEFRRTIHTCDPFDIPNGWVRFRAADWGYSSPACVLWFAVDWDGNLYVYDELYEKGNTAEVFAEKVLEREREQNIMYGVLDASAWQNRGEPGPSIAETMVKAGCRWRMSDRSKNSRVHGKLEVHKRLALVEQYVGGEIIKKPRLIIFNNCVNLIRTLPMLPLSKTNREDVDTTVEDHAYDALRYGCMSRPLNPNYVYSNIRSPKVSPNVYIPVDETFGYIE